MDTLLFATNNKNKAREVEEALKKINFPIHVITNQDLTDPPHVLETGTTFLANAKLKAHKMAEFSKLLCFSSCIVVMFYRSSTLSK